MSKYDKKEDTKDFKVRYSSVCTYSHQEDEKWGSWEAHYEFNVHSFCVGVPSDPSWDWVMETDTDPSKEDIPEEMYCVWVRYSDGDSFGHSTGNGKIVGLFKDIDLAHKLAKSISDDTYKPSGYGYKCWDGCFNTLQSVEVQKIPNSSKEAKHPRSYKKSY